VRLFVNYVADARRATPTNLAVARVLVGLYAAWKVASYPFTGLQAFPEALVFANPLAPQNTFFAGIDTARAWVPAAQVAIVACLVLTAIGRATRLAGAVAALLLAAHSGLNYLIVNERTYLLTIYFLIFHGLYAGEDTRRGDARKPGAPPAAPSRLMPLRLLQIVVAAVYFFAGVAKLVGGGLDLDWARADNVRLILQHNATSHLHEMPAAAAAILPHDALLAAIGLATLALELAFLPALLLRAPIGAFAVGLLGMHAGIVATMHLNYLTDMTVFFATFVAWDDVAARLRARRGEASAPAAAAQRPISDAAAASSRSAPRAPARRARRGAAG
jgi:hypothetical protein